MQNATIAIKKINKGQRVEIDVTGELTITNMEEMAGKIKKGLTKAEEISFTAHDVTAFDLTFLQLIIALKKEYQNREINFLIPENLQNQLAISGFEGINK